MPKTHGFCVYTFAHGGVGRTIEETDDIVKKGKELKALGERNEIYNVVCNRDKKMAIKKYNDSIKRDIATKKLKRELKKKSLKSKKNKSGGIPLRCGLSVCMTRRNKKRAKKRKKRKTFHQSNFCLLY